MTKLFTRSFLSIVISVSAMEKVAAQNRPDTIQKATQLENVTISRKKPLVVYQSDKTVLNVAGSIFSSGTHALDILAKAPGVTIDNEGHISLKGKSGVTVMLDGKATYLSAEQLSNLLRATPGNTIESIELISKPSAKYDAAGSGGLINIKFKKSAKEGTNGTISAGMGYGKYYKANSGVTFNHRKNNINIFGNFNYDQLKEFENLSVQRSNISGLEKTFFDVDSRDIRKRANTNYKAGIDYALNNKSIIGFVMNGYVNHNNIQTRSETRIGSNLLETDSVITADSPERGRYKNQNYNLNFKSSLDTMGREISADIDYSSFKSNSEILSSNYYYVNANEPGKAAVIFKSASPADIQIWAAKADYIHPLSGKIRLEAGIKSSYVKTNNNYQFENLESSGWQNDPGRSNQFLYRENINAAYLNYNQSFSSTTLQLGLRTEQTNSEGNSLSSQNLVKRSYLDFFPNIAINQTLAAQQEIGLSYNRRIDRPDYDSLNPFVYFADLYTLSQGNPLLNPQYTNSYSFSYSYQKKLNLSFGYSRTNNVITSTVSTDSIKKTLLLSEQNLALQTLYDFNASLPISLTKWWESNNDLSIFRREFSSPDLMGLPFKSKKLSFTFNTVQTFSLSQSVNAELSFNYQSPQVYGTYIAKPIYSTNFGISKSFAAKRASIKLAMNDIFNTQQIRIRSAIDHQDYRLAQKTESRIFRITLNYNFGSSAIKAVRERSNGAEGEQQRVKSGN